MIYEFPDDYSQHMKLSLWRIVAFENNISEHYCFSEIQQILNKYCKFFDALKYHFETLPGNLLNSKDYATCVFLPGLLEESLRKFISSQNSHVRIGLELKTAVVAYFIPLDNGCKMKIIVYFRLAETGGMFVINPLNIYLALAFFESVFHTVFEGPQA